MRRVAVLLVVIAGCGDRDATPRRDHEPPPPPPLDAGARSAGPVPIDPGNTLHLDDDVVKRPAPTGPSRQGKPIDIILRSTPSGAVAAVDGVTVGPTPAYWGGATDGHSHDFTFTLAGYELAYYRFVPITSGVVHARLVPVGEDNNPHPGADPEARPSRRNPAPPPTVIDPPSAPPPAPAPAPAPAPEPALAPAASPASPPSPLGPQP